MTKEELQKSFKSKILPENRDPYHFDSLGSATHRIKAYNPLCGDKFQLDLQIENDGLLSGYFQGFGCAVSKASTSILMRHIEGKSRSDVIALCENFLQSLEGGSWMPDEEDLKILIELRNFEGRVDCIALSWESLLKALKTES